jgi:hypothetical protein
MRQTILVEDPDRGPEWQDDRGEPVSFDPDDPASVYRARSVLSDALGGRQAPDLGCAPARHPLMERLRVLFHFRPAIRHADGSW